MSRRSLFTIELDYDDRELTRNTRQFRRSFDRSVGEVFDANAAYGTAWMKANAAWSDDTGAARAALAAIPSHRGTTHELLLTHGVHYGVWLETAHNRRDEVIAPAQRHIGDKIIGDLPRAFREAAQ